MSQRISFHWRSRFGAPLRRAERAVRSALRLQPRSLGHIHQAHSTLGRDKVVRRLDLGAIAMRRGTEWTPSFGRRSSAVSHFHAERDIFAVDLKGRLYYLWKIKATGRRDCDWRRVETRSRDRKKRMNGSGSTVWKRRGEKHQKWHPITAKWYLMRRSKCISSEREINFHYQRKDTSHSNRSEADRTRINLFPIFLFPRLTNDRLPLSNAIMEIIEL